MSKQNLILIMAVFLVAHAVRAEVVERIVAIVNDEIITLSDFNTYTNRLKTGGLTDDILIPDEKAKQELINDREKLLKVMIDEKVIDSEVKKQNLSVPIERVEQEIRSIAKRNNVSRDELMSALRERGVVFSQYQDFIKTGLERQSLIEKNVTSKIKISEDDVMSAFSQGNREMAAAYEYSLAHIYFQNQKGGAEKARQRADQVRAKLVQGESFEKLAGEASEDPAYEPGGLLGIFKTGELQPDLEKEVQNLNAGEFTGVLLTRGGFQIVKVVKKKLIPDPRTEKEREKIRAGLYEKAYKKQLRSWLEQMRQDAFIRINEK